MVAADVALPFDGQDAFEDSWRDMFGSWFADGVSAGALNELLVYGDSTGRQVKLKTGRMRLAGDLAGNDTEKTLTVTANASGNPRIDRVVARLKRDTHAIDFYVKAGTPGASPVPPTLTSDAVTTERSLARIGALASGYSTIAAGNVHPERALLSSHSVPAFDDDTARDLWVPSPHTGYTAALRSNEGLYEYWNGSWKQTLRTRGYINHTPGSDQTTGTNATWPAGLTVDVDVPTWATRAKCTAKISQVYAVTNPTNTDVRLLLGILDVDIQPHIRWDGSVATTTNAPQDLFFAGDIDCSSIAGTTVTLRVKANNISGSGALRANNESSCYADVEFR